jgi:hypothetical protein
VRRSLLDNPRTAVPGAVIRPGGGVVTAILSGPFMMRHVRGSTLTKPRITQARGRSGLVGEGGMRGGSGVKKDDSLLLSRSESSSSVGQL